jgi:anti-sigma factor RsiW
MSLVLDTNTSELDRRGHIGELRLRRLRAGELDEAARASVEAHTQGCDACRAKLARLEEEERVFNDAVPFARFSTGIEAARRRDDADALAPRGTNLAHEPASRQRGAHSGPRTPWQRGLLGVLGVGLAAAAGLVLVARAPETGSNTSTTGAPSPARGARNGTKGSDASAIVRIVAPGGASRVALPGPSPDPASEPVELLRAGEQLRVGYRAARGRHLVALTIDEAGVVTPLYPEAGAAPLVAASREPAFLPEGLTLTGVGRERLFVVLAAQPLSAEQVRAAATAAHAAAGGDLARASRLALPGEPDVTTWLFQKP